MQFYYEAKQEKYINSRLNLSPGPVDFRRFIDVEQEGLMMPHGSLLFAELYQRVTENLRVLLDVPPRGETGFITASGTGGIELLLLSALQPGDRVLIVANGFFGQRLAKMAKILGLNPSTIEAAWDRPFEVSHILETIHSKEFEGTRAVAVVHLETSTGLLNNLAPIGQALLASNVLFLVDGISSVGTHPVSMSSWGIDGLVTVTYKGLLSPPGLSILALSRKYCEAMENNAIQSYYFDLKKIIELSHKHTTATTIPVNALLTLDRVLLYILLEEQQHYERCRAFAQTLRQELAYLGLDIYGRAGHSHSITALKLPDAPLFCDARLELEKTYGIFVGSGLGQLLGKVIRIAHYGNLNTNDISTIAAACRSFLA